MTILMKSYQFLNRFLFIVLIEFLTKSCQEYKQELSSFVSLQ